MKGRDGASCNIVGALLVFQASRDPMVVDNIMRDLDDNKDGEVDFQEFVVMVAALTVACNEFFMDDDRSCNKGN